MKHDEGPRSQPSFEWHYGRLCFVLSIDDMWFGRFWDRDEGVLYLAPIPAFIFGIRLRQPRKVSK